MIGIIIQARTGSTRLPQKVLLDLQGKPILKMVLQQAQKIKKTQKIIIATTTNPNDDKIVNFCKENNVICFRGSEKNVLERYYLCAKEHSLDLIVRITSDCPFIDPKIVEKLINLSLKTSADYTSLQDGNERLFAHGLDAEVIKFSALKTAYEQATTDFDKEHVCTFLYKTNRQNFIIKTLKPTKNEYSKDLRITIDTADDLRLARELIKFLPKDFFVYDIKKAFSKYPYLKEINVTSK